MGSSCCRAGLGAGGSGSVCDPKGVDPKGVVSNAPTPTLILSPNPAQVGHGTGTYHTKEPRPDGAGQKVGPHGGCWQWGLGRKAPDTQTSIQCPETSGSHVHLARDAPCTWTRPCSFPSGHRTPWHLDSYSQPLARPKAFSRLGSCGGVGVPDSAGHRAPPCTRLHGPLLWELGVPLGMVVCQ